jgi:hypothetical protein
VIPFYAMCDVQDVSYYHIIVINIVSNPCPQAGYRKICVGRIIGINYFLGVLKKSLD